MSASLRVYRLLSTSAMLFAALGRLFMLAWSSWTSARLTLRKSRFPSPTGSRW